MMSSLIPSLPQICPSPWLFTTLQYWDLLVVSNVTKLSKFAVSAPLRSHIYIRQKGYQGLGRVMWLLSPNQTPSKTWALAPLRPRYPSEYSEAQHLSRRGAEGQEWFRGQTPWPSGYPSGLVPLQEGRLGHASWAYGHSQFLSRHQTGR